MLFLELILDRRRQYRLDRGSGYCCGSHINSHIEVRGHRTGSSHSGPIWVAERYAGSVVGGGKVVLR